MDFLGPKSVSIGILSQKRHVVCIVFCVFLSSRGLEIKLRPKNDAENTEFWPEFQPRLLFETGKRYQKQTEDAKRADSAKKQGQRPPEKPGTPLVKPPGTAQNTGREPRSNPTTRGLDRGPLRGAEEMTDGCKEGPRTPTPFQRKPNDWAVHLHEPAKELTAPRIRRFTTYSRWGGTRL